MQNQLENRFGLTEREMETIQNIFEKYPEVKKVFVFGSRAKGTYKQGSDVDLAVMNAVISDKTIHGLSADFQESSLPYRVELVDFNSLKNPDFISHIERLGILIYERPGPLPNITM
jgi:uncharacterized protein